MKRQGCAGDEARDFRLCRQGERGIALILVLWLLALVAILVLGFAADTGTELKLVRNQEEAAKARAIAEAGVTRAILGLLDPDPRRRWRSDGYAYSFPFAGGEVRIALQDEGGKIDVNRAPDEILNRLFLAQGADPGQSETLVAAIDQRRFVEALRLTGGGDGPTRPGFIAIDELRALPGMTPELYRRIAPDLTTYARRATIDPMTAPRDVLAALPGMTEEAADRIVAARAAADSDADLRTRLTAIGADRFGAISLPQIVTIRAAARTRNGARFVREAVVALAQKAGEPPFVLYSWRQGESDEAE